MLIVDVLGVGGCVTVNRPRRYPSDTSDTEWEITTPNIPVRGTRAGNGVLLKRVGEGCDQGFSLVRDRLWIVDGTQVPVRDRKVRA